MPLQLPPEFDQINEAFRTAHRLQNTAALPAIQTLLRRFLELHPEVLRVSWSIDHDDEGGYNVSTVYMVPNDGATPPCSFDADEVRGAAEEDDENDPWASEELADDLQFLSEAFNDNSDMILSAFGHGEYNCTCDRQGIIITE